MYYKGITYAHGNTKEIVIAYDNHRRTKAAVIVPSSGFSEVGQIRQKLYGKRNHDTRVLRRIEARWRI